MTAIAPSADAVREAALAAGVCARPVVSHLTDRETGERREIAIPCGSTRESRCPPCADRARRLRMHQCREGWHRTEEPEIVSDDELDEDRDEWPEEDRGRRVRSTRHRDDVPDLPRVPMEDRTVGRVFVGRDGKQWRPSMFVTLTLGSYGRVDVEGVPLDPATYDYRRAALDAMHFPKLVDRFWQNLRRCVGYVVQYFAVIEEQRRLAPHLHAAARGAFPRKTVHEVVAATYHNVWWPPHDEPVFVDRLPVWDPTAGAYVDPETGERLPSWDEALDELDADPAAKPAHVMRFGKQVDMQGLIAGHPDTDRAIGYLTKYLGKDMASTYDSEDGVSPARARHIDRLAEEVRWLPCSPTCANWLRYGVQPQGAGPGLEPGRCTGKAHERENLGLGGRRVLVSRRWTGKTLTDHRADRTSVVRAALEAAGIDPDDHDEFSIAGSDGRWEWEVVGRSGLDDPTYARVVGEAIRRRCRWREQYERARAVVCPRREEREVE